jgi:hypothetical protein
MKIAADAAAGLAGGIIGGLDKLFTSDQERAEATRKLTETLQAPLLAQMKVNEIEAAHPSIFTSGWRPFIGWVCGSALAYNFVLRELITWGLMLYDPTLPKLPTLEAGELFALVTGMLGLAGARSYDLAKGTRK